MTRPEISIIVPVYNVDEALLRACIESALGQTFTDFELILVDDASTDNSAAICASYSDPRIRRLRLPKNGGVSKARNIGVAHAQGKYIAFLDADDCMAPNNLECLHRIAVENDADIATASFHNGSAAGCCRTGTTDMEGQCFSFRHRDAKHDCQTFDTVAKAKALALHIGGHRFCNTLDNGIKIFSPTEATADVLYQLTLDNSPWSKLFRREVCVETPFPPGRYEDLHALPRMFLRANKVAWTPEELYCYTDNPASYMHTFNAGRAVVLDVTDELVDFMEKNRPELVAAARDRALSAAFNIYLLLQENRMSEPQIEARCKSTIRRYRRASLFNPRVRLKNKFGILLTYIGGFRLLRAVARLHPV